MDKDPCKRKGLLEREECCVKVQAETGVRWSLSKDYQELLAATRS